MRKYIDSLFNSKIIRNTLWLIADKFFRLIGGLLIGAWVARYLGPEQYGLINYVASFAAIFISFSMLGIDSLIIREMAKKEANINELLGTALKIRNIGSIVSMLLSLIFAYYFYYEANKLFVVLLFIVMLGNVVQSLDVISLFYQAKIQSKVIVKNKLIAYITISLFKILAVLLGARVFHFVILTVIESLIGVFLLYKWAKIHDNIMVGKWQFCLKKAKNFLNEGWVLALNNLCIIIFMKIDSVFLGNICGSKQVGIYSVAVLISDILYSVGIFVCSSTFPKMSEMYAEDNENYIKYAKKNFLFMVFYSYFCIICIFLFVDIFISTVYGPAYAMAAEVAKIHSLTLIFVTIGCVRGNMLIIEHKSKWLSIVTFTGSVLNIVLNLFFIQKFGVYGAAAAILISQLYVSYISGVFFRELRSIFIWQTQALFLYPIWSRKSTRN